MVHCTTLTIDLGAIVQNYAMLQNHVGVPIAAVLKGNAYGLGAKQVFQTLQACGCRHFFLAFTSEALPLLPLCVSDTFLYVLNDFSHATIDLFAHRNLVPVLYDPNHIALLCAYQEKIKRALPCALHIDTGLNRVGLQPNACHALAKEKALQVHLVMSHFVETHYSDLHEVQYRQFQKVAAYWPNALHTLANSSAISAPSHLFCDMVRLGKALYGVTEPPSINAMQLTSTILQIRSIAPGATVGYAATFRAKKAMRIAIVGCGYHDGIPLTMANKGYCMLASYRAPILGRIAMDSITIDVTNVPTAVLKNHVVINGGPISPALWKRWSGYYPYQHSMCISQRVVRQYKYT